MYYVLDTHRSVTQRLKLTLRSDLGAGSFFWHACDGAGDPGRPIVFRIDDRGALQGHSLAALRTTITRYAGWYREQGVSPSDRVALITGDGLLTFLHHVAITSLGAVTVPVNPRMAPVIAADYLARTGCSIVIGDRVLLDALQAATIATADDGSVRIEDVLTVEAQAAAHTDPLSHHPYRHHDDDLVMICHSSGTTGRPKATTFTHQGFFVGKRERLWTFPSRRHDRVVSALPHSHSAGLSYLSLCVLLGVPTLLVDAPSGASIADAMNRFGPTVVVGFPRDLADVPLTQLSTQARRSLHTWMGMGDVSHELHVRRLLGVEGSVYVDGLGSSEMGMVLFSHTHTAGSTSYERRIGRPARVVRDAAVLDEDGRRLPAGRAGRLGVRTPSSTPGYWLNEELTDRARVDGYFLTGDVVRRDGDGTWYHLDRTPDVIDTVAGPVCSLPVEELVLLTCEAIDAPVVAVDDPDHPGKAAVAAIVLVERDSPADPAALLERCNRALATKGLSTLRALVIEQDRAAVPAGVTGKLLKRELRERHRMLLSEPAAHNVALERGRGAGTDELIHSAFGFNGSGR
jgi:3-aminoavenalumate diazotase